MKIEDKIEFTVENPTSRITFETSGGETWKIWDRFISLDKEKMYHLGNICGTCKFFFIKQSKSLNVNFNQTCLIESLNNGKIELIKETVSELSQIIPNGNFLVLKTTIKPEIVTRESKNNYFFNEQRQTWARSIEEESLIIAESDFNNYYREPLMDFGEVEYDHKDAFFNFFIPLYNTDKLDKKRVDFYKLKINEGERPVAVSIGVLDVKTSEEYPWINGEQVDPEFGTHWCLANYIIDGHHKMKAASELNQEIGLITFISRDESWKSIDTLVSKLTGEKNKKW